MFLYQIQGMDPCHRTVFDELLLNFHSYKKQWTLEIFLVEKLILSLLVIIVYSGLHFVHTLTITDFM